MWDFGGKTLTPLTFDPNPDIFPVWTHDGRGIVFASARNGALNLYRQAADGTGSAERLTTAPHTQFANSVTPDGTHLLINEFKDSADISIAPVNGKSAPTPLLQGPGTQRAAEVSPNGRFVAYESDESGKSEIYVQTFPDVRRGRWQISSGGASKPVWSPNGKELFFIDAEEQLTAVAVETASRFTRGNATTLFKAPNIPALVSGRFYDVARDGRFIIIKDAPDSAGTQKGQNLVVVVNWPAELAAKVGGTIR